MSSGNGHMEGGSEDEVNTGKTAVPPGSVNKCMQVYMSQCKYV